MPENSTPLFFRRRPSAVGVSDSVGRAAGGGAPGEGEQSSQTPSSTEEKAQDWRFGNGVLEVSAAIGTLCSTLGRGLSLLFTNVPAAVEVPISVPPDFHNKTLFTEIVDMLGQLPNFTLSTNETMQLSEIIDVRTPVIPKSVMYTPDLVIWRPEERVGNLLTLTGFCLSLSLSITRDMPRINEFSQRSSRYKALMENPEKKEARLAALNRWEELRLTIEDRALQVTVSKKAESIKYIENEYGRVQSAITNQQLLLYFTLICSFLSMLCGALAGGLLAAESPTAERLSVVRILGIIMSGLGVAAVLTRVSTIEFSCGHLDTRIKDFEKIYFEIEREAIDGRERRDVEADAGASALRTDSQNSVGEEEPAEADEVFRRKEHRSRSPGRRGGHL